MSTTTDTQQGAAERVIAYLRRNAVTGKNREAAITLLATTLELEPTEVEEALHKLKLQARVFATDHSGGFTFTAVAAEPARFPSRLVTSVMNCLADFGALPERNTGGERYSLSDLATDVEAKTARGYYEVLAAIQALIRHDKIELIFDGDTECIEEIKIVEDPDDFSIDVKKDDAAESPLHIYMISCNGPDSNRYSDATVGVVGKEWRHLADLGLACIPAMAWGNGFRNSSVGFFTCMINSFNGPDAKQLTPTEALNNLREAKSILARLNLILTIERKKD